PENPTKTHFPIRDNCLPWKDIASFYGGRMKKSALLYLPSQKTFITKAFSCLEEMPLHNQISDRRTILSELRNLFRNSRRGLFRISCLVPRCLKPNTYLSDDRTGRYKMRSAEGRFKVI